VPLRAALNGGNTAGEERNSEDSTDETPRKVRKRGKSMMEVTGALRSRRVSYMIANDKERGYVHESPAKWNI
jgi:hypothetical protein